MANKPQSHIWFAPTPSHQSAVWTKGLGGKWWRGWRANNKEAGGDIWSEAYTFGPFGPMGEGGQKMRRKGRKGGHGICIIPRGKTQKKVLFFVGFLTAFFILLHRAILDIFQHFGQILADHTIKLTWPIQFRRQANEFLALLGFFGVVLFPPIRWLWCRKLFINSALVQVQSEKRTTGIWWRGSGAISQIEMPFWLNVFC